MMKISLFFKPQALKAYFLLAIAINIVSMPAHANAGFFSDLMAKVLPQSQAAEVAPSTDEVVHNSQTVPLLETSINPDTKSNQETSNDSIIEDETLISNNTPLGRDSDLEKYASSARISTYTVKKGDTIEGIAKKFKVSKDSVLFSNADIKKSDLLKVGQVLTIIPIDDKAFAKAIKSEAINKNNIKKDTSKDVAIKDTDNSIDEGPTFSINTDIPPTSIQIPAQNSAITTPITPTNTEIPSDQPSGTIDGGYIWIFNEDVGHISQMLHGANGIDIAAPRGTPILAVRAGTILIARGAGWNGAYGHYVVENFDNGAQGLFSHMDKVVVENGQTVKQGDILGYVGMTGRTTGPHVHFEVRGAKHPYRNLHVNATGLENND